MDRSRNGVTEAEEEDEEDACRAQRNQASGFAWSLPMMAHAAEMGLGENNVVGYVQGPAPDQPSAEGADDVICPPVTNALSRGASTRIWHFGDPSVAFGRVYRLMTRFEAQGVFLLPVLR